MAAPGSLPFCAPFGAPLGGPAVALIVVLTAVLTVALAVLVSMLVAARASRAARRGGGEAARDEDAPGLQGAPCLPAAPLAEALRRIRARRRRESAYGPAPAAERAELAALAAEHGLPAAAVCSLRDHEVAAASASPAAAARAAAAAPALRRELAAGRPFLEAVARRDLPPMAALRALAGSPTRAAVRAVEAGAVPGLTAADAAAAAAADVGSGAHGVEVQRRAELFERQVEEWVRRAAPGVEFTTERESRGGGGLTPDILVSPRTPLYAAGRRVHWLDAKNYVAYSGAFTRGGAARQAARYAAAFGPGAFVHAGGVECGLAPPSGAALLGFPSREGEDRRQI